VQRHILGTKHLSYTVTVSRLKFKTKSHYKKTHFLSSYDR
jgi:hypothetical protein